MKATMTHATRAELTQVVLTRYAAASGKAKRRILEEFIAAATGYHKRSGIRALNAAPAVRARQPRHRPSLYDEAVRAALVVPWEASDRVCGKPSESAAADPNPGIATAKASLGA